MFVTNKIKLVVNYVTTFLSVQHIDPAGSLYEVDVDSFEKNIKKS